MFYDIMLSTPRIGNRYRIGCRRLCLKRGAPVLVVFFSKLSWFVSELPEKDTSNVVVQCR